jgi:hypothetical protein
MAQRDRPVEPRTSEPHGHDATLRFTRDNRRGMATSRWPGSGCGMRRLGLAITAPMPAPMAQLAVNWALLEKEDFEKGGE